MLIIFTNILSVIFIVLQGYAGVQNFQNKNYQATQAPQPSYYLDSETGVWYMYYSGRWYSYRQNQWFFVK